MATDTEKSICRQNDAYMQNGAYMQNSAYVQKGVYMQNGTYIQKTICPYDCPSSCGLLAETDGTRIIRVKGDPSHPAAKGLICNKMQHYERSVHSQERILTPLKRAGAKGEGSFVPITWEEAAEEIAARWKKILAEDGGDAILPLYYSGVMSIIQRRCGDALFHKMGACRVVMTLCASAKGAGYEAVMGKTGCLEPRELEDSDFYLIWGSNVKATRIHTMPVLKKAREQGKRVVLIEVCACDMAPYCDEVILVRPGSDGALALAMMHVMVKEKLADEEYLREHADGYEAFRAELPQYTPQWAQQITGVPAARIEELAREYAAAKAPAVIIGSGPSRQGNGGMNSRLITILSAFTGAWGKPGGGLCGCNPGAGPYVDTERVTRPDFCSRAARVININQVSAALESREPGKVIKSLYVYGSNPVGAISNQTAMLRGLAREDLFTVVHERFMTDTARYADLILPAAFSVEQTDCYGAYGYCTFGTAKKVIEPAGQCKSNWDTFVLLAKAMGYEDTYFDRTAEDVLEELLAHPLSGLADISEEAWRTLKEGGVISTPFADHSRFLTESGRFMIVNESLPEPMPRYIENYGGAQPLRLVAVPSFYTLNSVFEHRKDLTEKRGDMILIMHPEDAAERGIEDGDQVIAYNEQAEVSFRAQLSSLIAKGAAAAFGVYSMRTAGEELLVNALTHGRLTDMGEATTLNDNTIEVRKLSIESR